jgi:pimeloyl-ACP methyl ester carboxylesterase
MAVQPALEVLHYAPRRRTTRAPLLFVHGAHVGAWCWEEHFLTYFMQHGYPACALSLRGHGASAGREALAWTGIDDYVADVLSVARGLPQPPILIGHSMGANIVQRMVGRSSAQAAVLMTPVPLSGLAGAALLLAARDPEVFRELAMIRLPRPPYARLRNLRRAVFSNKLDDGAALPYLRRMQPESDRALLELSWPQFGFLERADIPLLVLGAAEDVLFPAWTLAVNGCMPGAEVEVIPGMAHAMMLDPDWRRAADRILEWLEEKGC